MIPVRDVLTDAQKHLLKGEAEQALTCLQRFEEEIQNGQMSRENLAGCTDILNEIRMLAEAAREGTATAQRQIREIASFARGVNTYDIHGRKMDSPVTPGRDHRF